jgi:hypothetical protein
VLENHEELQLLLKLQCSWYGKESASEMKTSQMQLGELHATTPEGFLQYE